MGGGLWLVITHKNAVFVMPAAERQIHDFRLDFPWALPRDTLTMAVGQIVGCRRCSFPWALPRATLCMAVGQFVGCWWCGFPWALPKATLCMAVGQLWFVGGAVFPGRRPRLRCVWPLANCGRAAVGLGAHVRRAISDETVVGGCRGKGSFDPD